MIEDKPASNAALELILPFAGPAARTIIGLVFLLSGYHMAAAPAEEFAVVLEAYRILPSGMLPVLSYAIPWIEITLGLSLLLGFSVKQSAQVSALLLFVFIGALASTLLRGIPLENCGCFGGSIHLSPIQAIALDSVLICLSYLTYRAGSAWAPIEMWIEQGT